MKCGQKRRPSPCTETCEIGTKSERQQVRRGLICVRPAGLHRGGGLCPASSTRLPTLELLSPVFPMISRETLLRLLPLPSSPLPTRETSRGLYSLLLSLLTLEPCDSFLIKNYAQSEYLCWGWMFLHFVLFQKPIMTIIKYPMY